MAITNPVKRVGQPSQVSGYGPQATFAATVLIAAGALALCTVAMPRDAVLPVVSIVFFGLAALVAAVAWRLDRPSGKGTVTYWDVAGALTLIGIGAATFVDPDQMLRLVEGTHRNP